MGKRDLRGLTVPAKFFDRVNKRESSQLYLSVVSFAFCHRASLALPSFLTSVWYFGINVGRQAYSITLFKSLGLSLTLSLSGRHTLLPCSSVVVCIIFQRVCCLTPVIFA